jgi:TetR/AcrR family fatty acid metabolism transcriptional regulator
MKKNRYLAEVIHIELRQTSKLIREYRKNTFNEYLAIIAQIITQGQEAGIFRQEIHPQVARQIIFGALDEISRCWHVGSDCSFTTEEISSQMTCLFQTGLLVQSN